MSTSDVIGLLGLICAILSIIFVILAFFKNQKKDAEGNAVRLAKIETDIAYIREKMDERHEWEQDVEKRLRKLESK